MLVSQPLANPLQPCPSPLSFVASRWLGLTALSIVIGFSPLLAKEKGKTKNEAKTAKITDGRTPADVFKGTNIWEVHFHFSPDQWDAMEPKGRGGGFFGGPRGGGRGGFGAGMFMAPAFVREGDQNADTKLSSSEFSGLSEKWFAAWDKDKTGSLTREQVGAGMESFMTPPGGPGAGGPGPGARRPGMNLQGAEGKRNGLASAAGVEFPSVKADVSIDGRSYSNISIRYKGNGTWMGAQASGKRSLKADLNDHVKGQKHADMAKLNFHNNVTDPSWMSEPLAYRLYRDAGVPAPRTAYARVHVTVEGKQENQFRGLYSVVQNIDSGFAEERFGSKKGAIFKPVTPALFAYLGEDWKAYNQTYDPKTDLTPAQQKRVMDFAKLVTDGTDGEFASKVASFLDIKAFADYMAVTVLLSEMDGILGPGQNFYLHLDPATERFQFIPWDLDHSFGKFGMRGTQEEREQLSFRKPWQGQNRFLERMFKLDSFMSVYEGALKDFSGRLFLPERLARQVDETAAAIREIVKQESVDKLTVFDQAVAGESVDSRGGGFGQPIKPIKVFTRLRSESIQAQLAGKSEGKVLGEFGFGGRGGRRGGGPGGFMSRGFVSALDSNEDEKLSREEFTSGFGKWFKKWDTDSDGQLDEEQLREGLNADLAFRPPGGGPEGRPPGGERQ
ncbi:MAG: hypothetical protein FJ405_08410 [Verrucomicrobia bacterium]|nr:hypothetical protein [Verrucomicrobiota bacterium]